jgi:hypothetical protein
MRIHVWHAVAQRMLLPDTVRRRCGCRPTLLRERISGKLEPPLQAAVFLVVAFWPAMMLACAAVNKPPRVTGLAPLQFFPSAAREPAQERRNFLSV